MEKQGVIREGLTPPDKNKEKTANLEDHTTKRLADAVPVKKTCDKDCKEKTKPE